MYGFFVQELPENPRDRDSDVGRLCQDPFLTSNLKLHMVDLVDFEYVNPDCRSSEI
jgi:hypothetical protein